MKQGTAESLLSLAGSSSDADSTVQLTALLGNIDEKVGRLRLRDGYRLSIWLLQNGGIPWSICHVR